MWDARSAPEARLKRVQTWGSPSIAERLFSPIGTPYFNDWTWPDNSNSTVTIGFTLSRKLLGSLMPHFTYGTSNLLVAVQ
jgi:hypothetical protein